jgi:acetoacetyl-CoA synthetase
LFRPTINYAEQVLSGQDPEEIVLAFASEGGEIEQVSLATLRGEVSATSRWLLQLQVGTGDLVVGYLPSVPEAVTAFLATAAIGAVWSPCPPTMTAHEVAHRHLDFNPKALIGVERFRRGGVVFDRREEMNRLRDYLPHLLGSALVAGTSPNVAGIGGSVPPQFRSLDFDHPLLLSIDEAPGWPPMLRHGEALDVDRGGRRLRAPRQAGSRVLWAVDEAAPHWRLFASSLASDRSIVLYRGDPVDPDLHAVWDLCAASDCSSMVVDHTFIRACQAAGLRPAAEGKLGRLDSMIVTAPGPVEAIADWIKDQVGVSCRWGAAAPGGKVDGRLLRGSAAAWI